MPQHSTGSLPTLRYRLGMERPHAHLFQVEMHVPAWPAEYLDVAMPAWTPGAYKIVDNARNLRGLTVVDEAGSTVAVDRLDLHTWRVHHAGRAFTVRYQVYADKMTIHQAQLNASHAFISGCTVFLYPLGGQRWPAELTVEAPDGWNIATGLESTGYRTFRAPTYDDLIDCPLEAGSFEEATFLVDGIAYQIVWNGPEPLDRVRVTDGLRRIVAHETAFWGQAPYSRYVFIYNVTKDSYLNGLEHKNSTAIQGPINLDTNSKGFFALTAHELFHAWNVKRLRPIGLGPFDYMRPAHTTALWVVEGLTEYFTERVCLSTGITTPDEYLKVLCENLVHLEHSTGRKFTTLEEASFITWNFGDDRWNGAVNYYLKGSLMGAALDLELRHRTHNRKSLDDVMRLLWERFGAPDLPYDPEEVEQLVEEVAGEPMGAFFDHHLRSTADTDWQGVFALAGLQLTTTRQVPSLQARTAFKEGGCYLEDVRAQGACELAGLQSTDVIVSIAGRRANEDLIARLDAWFRVGDRVPVQFIRNDQMRETTLAFGADSSYALVPMEDPSPLQAAIQAAWLHAATAPAIAR